MTYEDAALFLVALQTNLVTGMTTVTRPAEVIEAIDVILTLVEQRRPCAICGKPQPCQQHGRTPVTDADFDELHRDVAEWDVAEDANAAGSAYWRRDGEQFVATIEASAQASTLEDAVKGVTRFVATAWPDAVDWPESKSLGASNEET
jgi:hypothetical protein